MAGEIFGGLMGAGSSGNPNFYIYEKKLSFPKFGT